LSKQKSSVKKNGNIIKLLFKCGIGVRDTKKLKYKLKKKIEKIKIYLLKILKTVMDDDENDLNSLV
jgi:hypothetical protein